MTLLVTMASPDFTLSCSDTRISVLSGNRYIPIDDKYNKHVVFHSNGFTGNISYTGIARWTICGKIVNLHDIISDSIAKSAKNSLALCPLLLNLSFDILDSLERLQIRGGTTRHHIEFHLVGYHKNLSLPFFGVFSTYRNTPPWPSNTELEWVKHFPNFHIYLKAVEKPEILFGGMDSLINDDEKKRICLALNKGADAFNMSKYSNRLIQLASNRNSAVGERSVSILLPKEGFLDTNLWEKSRNGIVGYLPKMIHPDGSVWEPSEFPVELSMVMQGLLPKHSLFFKSIVNSHFKRRHRQIIFRRKKGLINPGLLGLIMLALYGEVPEGYWNFVFDHHDQN